MIERIRIQGSPLGLATTRLRGAQAPVGWRPARRVGAALTEDEREKLQEARRHIDDVLGDRSSEEAAADEGQAPAEPAARIDVAAIYEARRRQASPTASGASAAPSRPRTIADVVRSYYGGGQADGAGLLGTRRRGGAK